MSTKPKSRERSASAASQHPLDARERVVTGQSPVVPRRVVWLWIKRGGDVVLSLLLIAPAALITLIAAVAVKLSTHGPAFYWQTRVGLPGREFRLCKLRTMISNAEAI